MEGEVLNALQTTVPLDLRALCTHTTCKVFIGVSARLQMRAVVLLQLVLTSVCFAVPCCAVLCNPCLELRLLIPALCFSVSADTMFCLLQVNYSSSQLDLLALLFTVVKLMYMGGALSRCAPLVQLLDTASQASAQELHKTLVRNEAAYFGCVKQLILQYPPPPQPQIPQPKPLYLCGDSHCLSGEPQLHLFAGVCLSVCV